MPIVTTTTMLANGLYIWNLALNVIGLVYTLIPSQASNTSHTPCEQQIHPHLYRSSVINIVTTVILLAAFNATHCFYADSDNNVDSSLKDKTTISWKSLLTYRAPFITMAAFYTCRVLQSLYYAVPIISLCLYERGQPTLYLEQRSNDTIILFIQCVTYVLIVMGGVAYLLSVVIPCAIK